jgi:2',3'-cyclic-nucleotide 2'-phosphodiesterase (5'-nucleotidase family)
MNNNRRDFIKKMGTLGGAGLLASAPVVSFAATTENSVKEAADDKPFILSILQTTDVHCQVHPHDELFWENEKAVFRKTGGYAHLATYLAQERKKKSRYFFNRYRRYVPGQRIIGEDYR